LEDRTAEVGVREPVGDADLVLTLGGLGPILGHTQILRHALDDDAVLLFPTLLLILDHLARDLAADTAQLALEVAHAGLTRVVVHDGADRALGDLEVDVLEAGLLAL